MKRREFLGGLGLLLGSSTLRAAGISSSAGPNLTLGVVSDIHLTTPGDEATFRKALEYFAAKNVDAVVLAGDIATLGRVEQLERCAACWKAVFPGNKGPDGRHVEKLFVYGNHDLIAWVWGADAAKQADPAYRATCITPESKGEVWERVFGEKYEPIWLKEVKGYTFIGAHWGEHGFKKFLEERKVTLDKDKPIFLVQHQHPRDTCFGKWAWGHDNGEAAAVLADCPKAVAFSGHSHYSLTDERSVWQGAFTSINAGSLEFAGTGYALHENLEEENVFGYRRENRAHVMPRLKTNDAKHGMVVSVWDDRLVLERRDFANGTSLGPDWTVPLPADGTYDYAARAARRSAPAFAPDARATVTVKDKRLTVAFPAARSVNGCRVFDYEVTATLVEDDVDLVQAQRRVIAPDFHLAETPEGRPCSCVFDLNEIMPRGHYVFSVRPIECFGKKGDPIFVETELKGKGR